MKGIIILSFLLACFMLLLFNKDYITTTFKERSTGPITESVSTGPVTGPVRESVSTGPITESVSTGPVTVVPESVNSLRVSDVAAHAADKIILDVNDAIKRYIMSEFSEGFPSENTIEEYIRNSYNVHKLSIPSNLSVDDVKTLK